VDEARTAEVHQPAAVALVGAALTATVWAYDRHAKGTPFGPTVMGACRSLNWLLGMTAAGGPVAPSDWLIPLGMGLYAGGITLYARDEAGAPIGDHTSPEDFMSEDRQTVRMVTVWTPLHGVLLHSLSAPHQVPFLGTDFYKQVRASPTWWLFLHEGTAVMHSTCDKGAEIMFRTVENG
jgi:hypothetical protein